LIIPFELKWNYRYLIALSEAISQVTQGDNSSKNRVEVNIKDPNSFLLKKNMHFMNDSNKVNLIRNTFDSRDINLQLIITDSSGKTIFADCYQPSGNFSGITSNNDYVLFGNEVEKETVQVKFKPNNTLIEKASTVKLTIESTCSKKQF